MDNFALAEIRQLRQRFEPEFIPQRNLIFDILKDIA